MNKRAISIFTLLLIISTVFSLRVVAQESILTEVSYLYMEKLVAVAKANYPKVKALGSEINMAKSDLSAAKISWLDPFSFQYVVRSNQTNVNAVDISTADLLNGYQFGVNFNPGVLFAKPGRIKKAKEQVKIAQANEEEYFIQLASQVKTRYVVFLQYQKSLLTTNEAYLNAESSFRLIKNKYQKGEASFLDYNDASQSLNQAFQTKMQVEANYLSSKISLEELTVVRLEEIK